MRKAFKKNYFSIFAYPVTINRSKSNRGNAFLYILVAVVLFGALIFALSRGGQQNSGVAELDSGRAKVAANEILSYAATAANNLTQMDSSGITADQIDFMLPNDSDFNTDAPANPNIHKLFHPSGGGLGYKSLPQDANDDDGVGLAAGYYIGRFNNIEWTPTTAPDIIFAAYEIKTPVCAEINRKLTGSTVIPTVSGDSLENFFIEASLHSGANAPFEVANCAACEEKPALCVANAAGKNLFYSILAAE